MATLGTRTRRIGASTADWAKAMNVWQELSNAGRRLGYQSLSPQQIGIAQQVDKDAKALHGEPVIIVTNPDGQVFNGYPYKGIILKTFKEGERYFFNVLYYPIAEENWGGNEKIDKLALFQIELVREAIKPDMEAVKKFKLNAILNSINDSQQKEIASLKNNKAGYEYAILSHEKEIKLNETRLKDVEAMIKAQQKPGINYEQMIAGFELLGKNKKIANAWLTINGEMIVETTMLYPISRVRGVVNKKKPIGRMVFKLNPAGISACRFDNLDYAVDGAYTHPNVSNQKICYGSNGGVLEAMVKSYSFYELTDFLLVFFTLFPHDSGGPHIPHMEWLKKKSSYPKTNPFIDTAERLWELHSGNTEESKPEVKAKKITIPSIEPTFESTYAQIRRRMEEGILAADNRALGEFLATPRRRIPTTANNTPVLTNITARYVDVTIGSNDEEGGNL